MYVHYGRRTAVAIVLALLLLGTGNPSFCSAGGSTVPTAYGTPEVFRVTMEYSNPPHLSQVTYFRRAVYVRGLFDHWEVLYNMTQRTDACEVSLGEAQVTDTSVVTCEGTAWLEIRYSTPVLHSNERYGTFQVGARTSVERELLAETATQTGSEAGGNGSAAGGLDVALRQLSSVEEFADYSLVQTNRYAQDIEAAFALGLIQGKYDDASRFFDPEALITTGEMINILARNLGADPTTGGADSVQYLSDMGLAVPTQLDGALSLEQLGSLATQIAELGMPGRGDLLVLREVLAGTLEPDYGNGLTRAHAVAMFRPEDAAVPPSTAQLPVPSDHDPNQPPGHDPDAPSDGGSGQEGGPPPGPGPPGGGSTGPGNGGPDGGETTAIEPVFVLTD